MINSLKAKFSLTVGITIIMVLFIFSSLIFATSIQNKQVITPQVLVEMPQLRPGLKHFLIETERISDIAEVAELVQAEQQAAYFKTVMLIAFSLTILSAAVAYFVAQYLLRPINELNDDIKKINPNDLGNRVQNSYNAKEIQFLATSFNHLMGELDEAFQSQERFVQDAAHELRTPIAAIKSNLDTARQKGKKMDAKEYEYLVETIDKLNDRLIKLNEELLFLNRKTDQKAYKKTDVNELIEDIVESVTSLAEDKGVRIDLKLDRHPIQKKIHMQNFSQAILNIVQNSIKYHREDTDSKVSIRTFCENDIAVIEIKDNGIGIPKKDLDNIFDRFYRADNAIHSNGRGEGLGLSITKKILDEHNAGVEVKSKLNRGTTFVITLA